MRLYLWDEERLVVKAYTGQQLREYFAPMDVSDEEGERILRVMKEWEEIQDSLEKRLWADERD